MKSDSERALVREFLLRPSSYPGRVEKVAYIETHISEVFLTGSYAYKIKKNLNLGFLDFSTLEARKFYIERELMLNLRYAPALYREVLPLYIHDGKISFEQSGKVCEYVLVMNQFSQADLFSVLCDENKLTTQHIIDVVRDIASFHASAEIKPHHWSFEDVKDLSMDNIQVLGGFSTNKNEEKTIEALQLSLEDELKARKELITKRQARFVKALHGDLHLNNICLFNGRATIFDGLEFNEKYSAIDTWADFSFLTMDLAVRGKSYLRTHAINEYLERTDDFEGLLLLRLYESYRAAVRAKVAALKLKGKEIFQNEKISHLIFYAMTALKKSRPFVICVGGLSGSGKSTLSKRISEQFGSVIIRSDAVRKHLLNHTLDEKIGASGYTPEVTQKVYAEMFSRALIAISEGYSVILDATFQDEEQRQHAENFFKQRGNTVYGFWCEVPKDVALSRIKNRVGDVSDADENVLERQYSTFNGEVEWIHVDTTKAPSKVLDDIKGILDVRL